MTDILLADIIPCKLCGALTTYDTRPWHLQWHARINARMLQPREPVARCGDMVEALLTPDTFLTCKLAQGHAGMHSDGTASWIEK